MGIRKIFGSFVSFTFSASFDKIICIPLKIPYFIFSQIVDNMRWRLTGKGDKRKEGIKRTDKWSGRWIECVPKWRGKLNLCGEVIDRNVMEMMERLGKGFLLSSDAFSSKLMKWQRSYQRCPRLDWIGDKQICSKSFRNGLAFSQTDMRRQTRRYCISIRIWIESKPLPDDIIQLIRLAETTRTGNGTDSVTEGDRLTAMATTQRSFEFDFHKNF